MSVSTQTHRPARLLMDLGQAGVEIALHPSRAITIHHRPRRLPPTLAARLRLAKLDIITLLRGVGLPDERDPEQEPGYVMGERLDVAMDLGMPTHPGSSAWLIAVGEALEFERSQADCVAPAGALSHEAAY